MSERLFECEHCPMADPADCMLASYCPHRDGPRGARPMRPAARSAAVRPHSSFPSSPRPASAASSCFASLFFRPCTPAHRQAIILVSRSLFPLSWEQIAPWEHSWEQKKCGITASYAIVPSVPTFPHARVIHMRAHTYGLTTLFLGTWEQCSIVFTNQRLAVFPSMFPAPVGVGTWEHSEGVGSSSDRLRAGANKVGPGYGDQRRPAVGARRKFRGSAVQAAGELEQQRIRQLPARRGGNGGNRPLSERLAGHVGRAMLEGSAQGPENAAQSAMRRKLGRLSAVALGELAGGATRRPSAAIATLLCPIEAPGAPNRAPSSPAMLALHARRIWIETASRRPLLRGDYSDRACGDRKMAQTGACRRGPGGARALESAKIAEIGANREAGERAGVIPPAFVARPHVAEQSKLRRVFSAVNGAST